MVSDIEVDVDDDYVGQGKSGFARGRTQVRSDLYRICENAFEFEVGCLERKQPGVELRDLPVALGRWQIDANHVMGWVPVRIRGAGHCGTNRCTYEAESLD